MPSRLVTKDVSLRELLAAPHRFQIPHYQREYAWEKEHTTQLLDDILLSLDEADDPRAMPCFLGTILVYRQDGDEVPAGERRLLDVVDGQQRLITLTMLLACLRDGLEDPEKNNLDAVINGDGGAVLSLRQGDAEYFRRMIQSPGVTRKPPLPLEARPSVTHVNIHDNRAVMLAALAPKRMEPERRRRLARHIQDATRVVLIEADDLDYAHQIFVSINERGMKLTVEDIFQAELLGPLDASQQIRYAPIIGHIGKYRPEGGKPIARGKTFFSHFVFAHGTKGRALVTATREAIRAEGGPKPFVQRKFVPFADAYLVLSGLELPNLRLGAEARTAIEHLQMLEAHGDDDWMATAMLAMARLPPASPELGRILTALDRFAHILLALGHGADKRKRRHAPINQAILDKEPWTSVQGRLVFTAREEREALKNLAQEPYAKDKATSRLVLIRVDAHLSGRPLMYYRYLPEYPLRTETSFTVEHLLPKGVRIVGEGSSEWTTHYPDPRHRQACAQYLSNLTLVRNEENKDLGQWGFRRKMERLQQQAPHPIHMNNELAKMPDWSFAALTQRHRVT